MPRKRAKVTRWKNKNFHKYKTNLTVRNCEMNDMNLLPWHALNWQDNLFERRELFEHDCLQSVCCLIHIIMQLLLQRLAPMRMTASDYQTEAFTRGRCEQSNPRQDWSKHKEQCNSTLILHMKYDCEICEFWLIWNITVISWWIRLVISHMTNLWLVRAFGILCKSVVVLEHEGNIVLRRACSWPTDGTTTTGTTTAAAARHSHNATGAARQRANQEVRIVVVQQQAVGNLTTHKNTHNNRLIYRLPSHQTALGNGSPHCYVIFRQRFYRSQMKRSRNGTFSGKKGRDIWVEFLLPKRHFLWMCWRIQKKNTQNSGKLAICWTEMGFGTWGSARK